MNCPKCNAQISLQLAANIKCKNCKVLTSITSIATIQCESCQHIFQQPIQANKFMSLKKEDQ
ncbi:MAG TPA: hypothetical protein VJK51_04720 [Candidatus Nanoarchaeia archaeon]|nr:hypothetical protein [Candidatus Nanoarchaeia archaeon]